MKWNIIFYQKASGEYPVAEFLSSLPKKHLAKAIWEIDLQQKDIKIYGRFFKEA